MVGNHRRNPLAASDREAAVAILSGRHFRAPAAALLASPLTYPIEARQPLRPISFYDCAATDRCAPSDLPPAGSPGTWPRMAEGGFREAHAPSFSRRRGVRRRIVAPC